MPRNLISTQVAKGSTDLHLAWLDSQGAACGQGCSTSAVHCVRKGAPSSAKELFQAYMAKPANAPLLDSLQNGRGAVVFAGASDVDEQVTMGALAWPKACVVIAAGRGSEPTRLTERVRAELRWSGNERQPHARPEMELRPWLSLEPVTSRCVVHVTDDVFACGTDLVIASFARDFVGQGLRLKLVVSASTRPSIDVMLREIGPVAA